MITKDFVCGLELDPETSARKTEFNGQVYCFCSEGCLNRFEEDPGLYLTKAGIGMEPRVTASSL